MNLQLLSGTAAAIVFGSILTPGLAEESAFNRYTAEATLAMHKHDYDACEKACIKAVNEAEKYPRSRKIATSLSNLAHLYRLQGKVNLAVSTAEKALRAAQDSIDPVEIAVCDNNLGKMYAMENRYKEAEPLLKSSVDILKDKPDQKAALMFCMENYADLLKATNRKAESDKMEASAKAIRDKLKR